VYQQLDDSITQAPSQLKTNRLDVNVTTHRRLDKTKMEIDTQVDARCKLLLAKIESVGQICAQ
jgi:hypothetical protein